MSHKELVYYMGKPFNDNIPSEHQTLLPKGLFIIIDPFLGSLLRPEAERDREESSANHGGEDGAGHVLESHDDKDSDVVMEVLNNDGRGTLMKIPINKIMYVSTAIGMVTS